KSLRGRIPETVETEIDGVTSRRLPDRGIARLIEEAWSAEVRSPSNTMQELSGRLRGAGLQIFRHRKGMLFVSPIRLNPIDESAVSDSVREILETLKACPRINRKQLGEKLIPPNTEATEAEKMKLSLASDLHWMIREGHVIAFHDGSLDLPRAKPPKREVSETAKSLPLETAAATPSETPITETETGIPLPVTPSEDASPAPIEEAQDGATDKTSPPAPTQVFPSEVEGARG